MKFLMIHNFYKISGGEDFVLENEVGLLKSEGQCVAGYMVDNASIVSNLSKLFAVLNVIFSINYYRRIKATLLEGDYDVVHVHNYFPLISPAIFYACKSAGIPVVHTLHNFRAVCPTALLMHDGKINEQSLNGSSWWTVSKKVYRDSFVGSFALACMVQLHKKIGTWQIKVDRYIALTQFARQKYIEAGWPQDKVVVKPNFIQDPFDSAQSIEKRGGYALYVGRLSEEKGIDILFDGWKGVALPLKIIGDGPLKARVASGSAESIEYLGRKDKEEVLELVQNADFILMPSTWYEGFPMVLVEAFACGTPAVVSRLGSMEEIVEDGVTGLHFEAGNAEDLAVKAQWLTDHPEQTLQMGHNARQEYLAKYTPEKNYAMLMDIYQQAIDEAKKR